MAQQDSELLVVHPVDNGQALRNPGLGWVLHYYDNALRQYGTHLDPADTLEDFPGMNVVYLRLPWSHIEPEQGRFDWSIVDGPAQRFIDAGWQVAFRFTCCETPEVTFATPEWVVKDGAKGIFFEARHGRDENQRRWEPLYDDPIFLKHLEAFLAAAGRRYDGNPNVAWIDVGSYGVWGEGHTTRQTGQTCPPEVMNHHVELHAKYFKKTLVALNDDLKMGRFWAEWAKVPNMTLRDDSILVNSGEKAHRSAHMAQPFWPNAPVILESGHYNAPRHRGYWDAGAKYVEATEAYRASYLSVHHMPREFYEENKELVAALNRRMGYRINLLEAAWPGQVALRSEFEFTSRWKNVGVAPCYPGGHPAVTLKTAQGGIVAVFIDEAYNMRDLPVDKLGKTEVSFIDNYREAQRIRLPEPGSAEEVALTHPCRLATVVKPGTYDVYISVGLADGTPTLFLPLDGHDGQRRYKLGQITVTE